MKRLLLAALLLASAAQAAPARDGSDLCHVYVVDVEKARRAREEYRDTGDPAKDTAALAAAQVVFPEFRAVVAEERLTTKSYPFPGRGRLFVTASVYYTDESMRSAGGADSMLLAVAVAARPLDDALSADDNAAAELTLGGADTARAKKNLRVGGRLYLVGVECRCKERGDDDAP